MCNGSGLILNTKSIEKCLNKYKPNYLIHLASLSRPMIIHEQNISSSIDTNIVILHLDEGFDSADIVAKWGDMGILCFPFSKSSIRFVTHLDLTDDQITRACEILCR